MLTLRMRWAWGVVLVAGLSFGAGANAGPEAEAVEWVRQSAFRLDTVEFDGQHNDLLSLVPLLEGADIVALGEGTHGTREFFTVRQRMIEFLVTELGFADFAFEFPYGEGVEVNKYIHTGEGNPAEILARVYCPPWNSAEVLDLIEWMRSYNATRESAKALSFHGIDIHDGSSVLLIESILCFIEKVDPSRRSEIAENMDCFRYNSMYDIATFADTDGECRAALSSVVDTLARQRARYVGASARHEYAAALHEARLLCQRAEHRHLMTTEPREADDLRDRYMADNLAWVVENAASGERVVLAAHNYHIGRFFDLPVVVGIESRTQTSMGWHLGERYGDAYVPLATTTRAGELAVFPFPGSSLVSEEDGRGIPQREFWKIPQVRSSSMIDVLRAAGVSPCLLDLRVERGTPGTDWLFKENPFLHIGTMFFPTVATSYSIHTAIAEPFDFLLYIDETRAPGMLPWTPWETLPK
jgi:erythromycin esterase